MKKKTDLVIIIICTLTFSIISIILFNIRFPYIKIGEQSLRLIITLLLCYFLYQEKQWARWIFVILYLIGGIAGLAGIIINFKNTNPSSNNIDLSILILFLASLFFIIASLYIGFIRNWKK